MQANRQTYRNTQTLIAILRTTSTKASENNQFVVRPMWKCVGLPMPADCLTYTTIYAAVCCRRRPYRNEWTDRGGFWHGSFLPHILHVLYFNEIRALQK